MTNDDVTTNGVSAILELVEKSVYSMAELGEFPAFKFQSQRHIRRLEVDRLMDKKLRGGTSGKR